MTDSVLESITRDTILKIAINEGYKVTERTIDRTELYTCDEAFLCGSAMEITPVLSIDKYGINNCEIGTITSDIHLRYLDVVSGINKDYMSWLTPIYDK